ncbi:MAG TPA: DUF192 domain-containing protein [Egibacteraceae bacterium]|nr:DUF192 domain-containing protein [Egibacteraceae bacterium]
MQDRPRIAIAGWLIALAAVIVASCAAQPSTSDPPSSLAAPPSAPPLDAPSPDAPSPSAPPSQTPTGDSAPSDPPVVDRPATSETLDPSPRLSPWPPFSQTVVELRSPDGVAHRMPVHVAATPAARRLGLMGRSDLPSDVGMLFLFDSVGRPSFWMKDTPLPLSIAFFDADGRLLATMDMDPCLADPCPRYAPDADYLSAIEANRGFFERLGVGPGWRLEVDGGLLAE